jgi:maltose/moltooligosaccharide transporter
MTDKPPNKPRLDFWQIWNMSFGFLGIQFGWGLQMANMSAIYEYLGARADQIPILWLAAPLTGLIVQPIIGHASDRTWNRLGRRRPYFLTGAILSSAGADPDAARFGAVDGGGSSVDTGRVDQHQHGAVPRVRGGHAAGRSAHARLCHAEPVYRPGGGSGFGAAGFLLKLMGSGAGAGGGQIPLPVRISFYIGAAAFFGAVMYTIATTREYPPEDLEAFRRMKAEKRGLAENAREILESVAAMPQTMKQLAWVQIATWLGLFCMWLYFPVAVAHNVFGATDPHSALYTEGVAWGGYCFAMYSAVCFVWSFALPPLANALGRKATHSLCLLCGAAGLMSVAVIHNKWLLFFSMVGVGIAWASTISMPYAILAGSLPAEKTGIYMGIFNFFIVTPEIVASLGFGWVMAHLLGNNRLLAVVAGGVFFVVAAALMQRVRDVGVERVAGVREGASVRGA